VREDHNERVLLGLAYLGARIAATWHHKALPNGEYAQTVEELRAAYPDLEKTCDIEMGVSPYTGRQSVLVRGRDAHAMFAKRP